MPPSPRTEPAAAPLDAPRLPAPLFTLVDKLMIVLAVVSGVIIVADIFYRPRLIYADIPGFFFSRPPAGWHTTVTDLRDPIFGFEPFWWVMLADLVITAIFAVEFFSSAAKYGSLAGYTRANWFDALGMLPMALFVALDWYVFGCTTLPALAGCVAAGNLGFLRFLRFARIIRIFVAGSRLARAANMTFGEQVVTRLFDKYKAIIVAELTTPILIQAVSITQGIVTRGKYAESVGKELDAKRDEIYALIIKNLESRKSTATVIQPEFVREAIRRAEEEVLNTVVLTLTSEELNKIIADTLDRVLEDFKRELRKKDWAHVAFAREAGDAPGGAP